MADKMYGPKIPDYMLEAAQNRAAGEAFERNKARILALENHPAVKEHKELQKNKDVQRAQTLSEHPAVQAYEANKAATTGTATGKAIKEAPSGFNALNSALQGQ